ncbi:16S rRNA (adenine(1518)-N(6)/adenine(1519)-N(6))-dimethyltransferase RsmA [bacterium]|nr:16S rRNA (adenine(1518)-N(6)/adenine(1519)-N(6))-dimethyltransferase RsmA [bacterium]
MKRPKLGQHFLKETRYIAKALQAAEIMPDDGIIEVGPGKGILTKALLKKSSFVTAIELDERLANRLHEKFGHFDNLSIHLQDARQIDWTALSEEIRQKGYPRIKLIANLPYYLASQMVIYAMAADKGCDEMVVMVQDEVARRMCAQPGTKEYSSYSIAVQYYGEPKYIIKVPPSAFNPPPRVSSALVKIVKRSQPLVALSDPDAFFYLVHAMFTHRRKTLRNCLQGLKNVPELTKWEEGLQCARIDSQRRPETLSIFELASLYQALDHSRTPSE